jgi:hypothetical protein
MHQTSLVQVSAPILRNKLEKYIKQRLQVIRGPVFNQPLNSIGRGIVPARVIGVQVGIDHLPHALENPD